MNNYKYSAREFYDLIVNNSEYRQYASVSENKVILRLVPVIGQNYSCDQSLCLATLGAHKNFCLTLDVELDDNYQCPSVGFSTSSTRFSNYFFNNDIFYFNNGAENGLLNNKTKLKYITTGDSYYRLGKTNKITVAKQGTRYYQYINGHLIAYVDGSDTSQSTQATITNTQCYLHLFWNKQGENKQLSYCAFSNVELSMSDYPIDNIVKGENFYAYGEQAEFDASASTQEEGTLTYYWDGELGEPKLKIITENTQTIKLDVVGSKGGHLTTYHNLILADDLLREKFLLSDLFLQFKKNYISVTNRKFYPSLFLNDGTLSQYIDNRESPASLNSDIFIKNGSIDASMGYHTTQGSIVLNMAQTRYKGESLNPEFESYTRQDVQIKYGIAVRIANSTNEIDLVLGTNLLTEDGISFVGNSNLDVFTERYGEDLTPKNSLIRLGYIKHKHNTNWKIRIIRYDENILVFFDERKIFEFSNPLIKDLAGNQFNILNLLPQVSTDRFELNSLEVVKSTINGSDDEDNIQPIENIIAGIGDAPRMALMIENENLEKPICLYQGFKNVFLKNTNDEALEFNSTGMEIGLPERKAGSADNLSFGIGEVSGEVLKYCEIIRNSAKPAYITVLQYQPFDEITNTKENAPAPSFSLRLFITSCAITLKGATFNAGWHDTLNAKFPAKRYTATEYPGLKYVV